MFAAGFTFNVLFFLHTCTWYIYTGVCSWFHFQCAFLPTYMYVHGISTQVFAGEGQRLDGKIKKVKTEEQEPQPLYVITMTTAFSSVRYRRLSKLSPCILSALFSLVTVCTIVSHSLCCCVCECTQTKGHSQLQLQEGENHFCKGQDPQTRS